VDRLAISLTGLTKRMVLTETSVPLASTDNKKLISENIGYIIPDDLYPTTFSE